MNILMISNLDGDEKVFDVALASYVCEDGSPSTMLECIRKGTVKELLESLPDVSKMADKEREKYQAVREQLVNVISQTA